VLSSDVAFSSGSKIHGPPSPITFEPMKWTDSLCQSFSLQASCLRTGLPKQHFCKRNRASPWRRWLRHLHNLSREGK
jgi:hypothetical protein